MADIFLETAKCCIQTFAQDRLQKQVAFEICHFKEWNVMKQNSAFSKKKKKKIEKKKTTNDFCLAADSYI